MLHYEMLGPCGFCTERALKQTCIGLTMREHYIVYISTSLVSLRICFLIIHVYIKYKVCKNENP